jgi:signal transduction histidine kinase
MSFARTFARQPRGWIIAEMVASLLVIALLDFITGYKIRLLPFYAGPIFILAWFCGKKWGLAAAFFSGVIWWCANWFTGDPDLHSSIEAWEMFRHLGFFVIVALVGSALRAKSDIAEERIALLEHSERLEGQIVNISDSEQQRIGQDLHDGLCQYLAGLTCCASSLREDLEELNREAEAARAGELAKLLQDAVVQTRDLARRLVPAHIDRLGLALALEFLADSVTRHHGVICTFALHGEAAGCDQHTAIHLYRIAQEAINNATRHGQAKNIAISLKATDHSLCLRVSDDGGGISETGSEGIGLTIMRYRARLVGGELTIGQRNGSGTVISCTAGTNSHEHETATA